ncbi:MAG: putative RND superfamily exporter protein [Rhodothermales bacterium]|jgi:predicted RND superfamily exporter protein
MNQKESEIDRRVASFTRGVLRYRWAVLVLTLLATLGLGAGAGGLFFDTDYRAFFGSDNPQVLAFDELQNVYTKNDNILFVLAPESDNVTERDVASAIEALVAEAWTIPYAIRVDAISNFQHTLAEGDDLIVRDLIEDAEFQSDEYLSEAQRIALNEPLLARRLINESGSVTGVNVTLQLPGLSPEEVPESVVHARQIAETFRAENPKVTLYVTGFAMLNNAFMEISMTEMSRLIPFMFGAMMLLMLLTLRSVTGTLATVMVIMFSTAAAMGLGGYFSTGLTPPSAQAPTIIMTLAIADSIHILVSILGLMRGGLAKTEAIVEGIRINFMPVFWTSVSTIIGFLSLNFSDVPPFNHLGNMTAAGVLVAFILSVTFLPAIVSILPVRAGKKGKADKGSPILDGLADMVIARKTQLLIGTAVTILALAAFIPSNELDDRFVEYFGESTDFRKDTDFTSENLTGIYQLQFSIPSGESGGISDPSYLANLDSFTDWLRTQEGVVHVSSITDIMRRLNKNLNGDDPSFYRLPEERDMAAQYLLLYEMSLPYGLDLNDQINVDKSASRLTVTSTNLSATQFRSLAAKSEGWLRDNAPEHMFAIASGPALMFSTISGININSMLKGSILALLLISLLMIGALRSLKLGLISFLPNLLPAVIAFGIWGILDGTVNLGLSIVIGMTMGIVVDDSIHFLSKYRRARREKGLSPEDSVRYAFTSVGRALIATSAILVVGFLILSTSVFGMNADMGLMTAITIAVALIVDFFALPPLLLLLDRDPQPAAVTNLKPAPARVSSRS